MNTEVIPTLQNAVFCGVDGGPIIKTVLKITVSHWTFFWTYPDNV